jgi:hypothetical protein
MPQEEQAFSPRRPTRGPNNLRTAPVNGLPSKPYVSRSLREADRDPGICIHDLRIGCAFCVPCAIARECS